MHLTLARLSSPVGTILLASEGDTLRALHFEGPEDRLLAILRRRYPAAQIRDGRAPAIIATALADYFDGSLTALDAIRVASPGTPFETRVWDALRRIPTGTTTSYGALAASLGHPRASRAVGLANGSNPISIVVPCHRVIGADGRLTGYGGGLPRKRWLLEHEGVELSRGALLC